MMNHTTNSSLIPNLFRAACRLLPGVSLSERAVAPVYQKAPPRLSLAQSLAEDAARRHSADLTWFLGGR